MSTFINIFAIYAILGIGLVYIVLRCYGANRLKRLDPGSPLLWMLFMIWMLWPLFVRSY